MAAMKYSVNVQDFIRDRKKEYKQRTATGFTQNYCDHLGSAIAVEGEVINHGDGVQRIVPKSDFMEPGTTRFPGE